MSKLWIVFTDLMFNLLAFITFILMLLLIRYTVETSEEQPDNYNLIVIQAEWDHETKDDIDLWVRDPAGQLVGFKSKVTNGMVLQFDDLGIQTDVVTDAHGNKTFIKDNREEVNIRKTLPGIYHVNLIYYKRHVETVGPTVARLKVIVTNPFTQFESKDFAFTAKGQETTLARFQVDEYGSVKFLPLSQMKFTEK